MLISLSPPRGRIMAGWEPCPVAHLSRGPSCGQNRRGACRTKGLMACEHVPDRLGKLAGDLDAGDLLAALPAEALHGGLVVIVVGGMLAGVGRCLNECPAQVLGAVLGQRPAAVLGA